MRRYAERVAIPRDALDTTRTRAQRVRSTLTSAAPPAPEIPGFELRDLLGRGGMAFVWRARERATERDVAIKWVPASAPEALRKRFQREARAVAKLRHPHIVTVLSAGETAAGSWIAMELVDGFPLSFALEEKALGRNALVDVIAKVARALAAAHDAGILHRDVKPANILVDQHGEPRLVDFGLARFEESDGLTPLTGTGVVLGTVGTMAPEVVQGGGRKATRASDIFSLGAVLHEGLAGKPPFGSGPFVDVMARIVDARVEPLPDDVPVELATLARACLERDPARRPVAHEVARRLEEFLRGGAKTRVRAPAVLLVGVPLASALLGAVVALSVGRRGEVNGASSALPILEAPREPLVETKSDPRPTKPAKSEASDGERPDTEAALPAPPAAKPGVAAAEPGKASTLELDGLLLECIAALGRDDRRQAARVARDALARAPEREVERRAGFHAVLARVALHELKVEEAEREVEKALALDSKNATGLLVSFAGALLARDEGRAKARYRALDELGRRREVSTARGLLVIARRDQGYRLAVTVFDAGKDPFLKAIVAALLAREPVSFEKQR